MVNSNVNALGVIFANTYDNLVPELVAERSMGSIPFGGRYLPDRLHAVQHGQRRHRQRVRHRA